MAKYESLQSGVYIGKRDCTADAMSIEPKFARNLHDSTSLADADKKQTPGVYECSYSAEVFFDDADGVVQQLQTASFQNAVTGSGITSVFPGHANAIGSLGVIFPDGFLKTLGQSVKYNNLVMMNLEYEGSGKPGLNARMLHVLGAEAATGNSASYDNAVLSANGGMANLHVTAITGANPHTIKVQHSVDNSTWVDLITFASVSAIGAQSPTPISGTVNRYLRVTFTIGATSSATFVVGFSRF